MNDSLAASAKPRMCIALVLNPIAGIGGSVALKGSDGVVEQALARGAEPMAEARVRQTLECLLPYAERLTFIAPDGAMGAVLLRQMGFAVQAVIQPGTPSSAADTRAFCHWLNACEKLPDLLLFAGGDGTARDIYEALDVALPVIGIPAGCKIHSGVYAISPVAAGELVREMLDGQLLSLLEADVMDIDEAAFRQGRVRARRFGELSVPADLRFVQSVKQGGIEHEALVLTDIADDVVERMEDDTLYIVGSGSTVAAVMERLALPNTLLGIDLVAGRQLVAADVTAAQILDVLTVYSAVQLLITPIGGQGHVFGRGNQQLSPPVIRQIGREHIQLLATKSKLKALQGRPLLSDTGDRELDSDLAGYYTLTTGYHDYVRYPLTNPL